MIAFDGLRCCGSSGKVDEEIHSLGIRLAIGLIRSRPVRSVTG